jgi:hypothetical protein
VGVASTILFLLVSANIAYAATGPVLPLSRILVSSSLPGYQTLPRGPFNGPLSVAKLDGYSSDPQWRQDVAAGRLTGYQRTWSHIYAGGPSLIYVSAFRLPSASDASLFMTSIGDTAAQQPSAQAVPVPGLSRAVGYTSAPHAVFGYGSGRWIIFTKGDLGFFVYAVVPPGRVSPAQLTALARRQLASAPSD